MEREGVAGIVDRIIPVRIEAAANADHAHERVLRLEPVLHPPGAPRPDEEPRVPRGDPATPPRLRLLGERRADPLPERDAPGTEPVEATRGLRPHLEGESGGRPLHPAGGGIGVGIDPGEVGLQVEHRGAVEEVVILDGDAPALDPRDADAGEAHGVRPMRGAGREDPALPLAAGGQHPGSPPGRAIEPGDDPDPLESGEVVKGLEGDLGGELDDAGGAASEPGLAGEVSLAEGGGAHATDHPPGRRRGRAASVAHMLRRY